MIKAAACQVNYRRVRHRAQLEIRRVRQRAAVERYAPRSIRGAVDAVHDDKALLAFNPAALFSDYGSVDPALFQNFNNGLLGQKIYLARNVASGAPAHLPVPLSSAG